MGKLNYEPHIMHFSHEHPMELINIPSPQQPQNKTKATTTCSGCKERASPDQWIYTCKSCNFNLHIPCSQMPKVINHPSDPNHPLILLPSPAYPCGTFNCDGCGCQKNTGFSYHCTACSLDLHILCAAKPLSVNHHAHLAHPLTLTFYPPYETNGFSCDICHKLGMNHWLYRCASCGFDAHIGCATANDNPNTQRAPVQQPQPQPQPQPQSVLQHHYSFPGGSNQPQFVPQGIVHQGIPVVNNNLVQPPQQKHLYHANSSPNMGASQQMMMNSQQAYSQQLQLQQQIQQMQMQLQLQQQQQIGCDLNPQLNQQLQLQQQQLQQLQQLQQQQQQNANDAMTMAIQGMMAGASQQLGQSLLQNAMGGGNNDGVGGGGGTNGIFESILGGGNNGGDGDSSASLLKIGSQVLGLMF